ncbi:glycoside hydrolase family 130 protein [Pedobacter metabolipauper]|uniref:Putative GH43/DUF377 family glycosyl hydrolase n=1 Tax=Pedobacter metabolipauper TaxID=425513 RepID=A0A4V3D1F4_9SPHI|nr:glycoside hydrolase family 130 protein [Pedobacter metabolipauper]TDQ11033.1 putative GH43/DUF377 family glycosyl hydrolase [Pedobacter metabolipauper]
MNRSLQQLTWLITLLLFTQLATAQDKNVLPAWALGGFARPTGINPIISPNPASEFYDPMSKKLIYWEANDTFNPAAAVKNGKIIVLYRSEDNFGKGIGSRTSRLGYAESSDGLNFTRKTEPVFFPADDSQKEYEWPGGCEDPRVSVTENGTYVVFYTQWNRKTPRLGVATSKDLINWKKEGPIFQKAYNGKFFNISHKSASILTRIKGDKQVITRINGKYFMYWGESAVYGATSVNLTDWSPIVDKNGELQILASTRPGHFDSGLTECGPPALLTEKGIILLYNGKNRPGDAGDRRFNGNAYCAGQMLFSKSDPTQLLDRLNVPFLRPMEAFEKSGQYVNGTVFIEGMAWFKNKWYLYYGCADSKVGVAVYDPAHPAAPDPLTDEVK